MTGTAYHGFGGAGQPTGASDSGIRAPVEHASASRAAFASNASLLIEAPKAIHNLRELIVHSGKERLATTVHRLFPIYGS
jgi:hypothetical protein